MNRFDHIESVYWVFTQLCNDQCDIVTTEWPQGARLQDEEVLQIIDNLPQKMDRLILSGGEPLAERKTALPSAGSGGRKVWQQYPDHAANQW